MSASEFHGWQAFFSIYPFSQDREDRRVAMLSAIVCNVSGKTLKHLIKENELMPDYLQLRSLVPEKSLEQQAAEFKKFKAEYLAVTGVHNDA